MITRKSWTALNRSLNLIPVPPSLKFNCQLRNCPHGRILAMPVWVSKAAIISSQKTLKQVETHCLSIGLREIVTLSFDNFTKLSLSKQCRILRSFQQAIWITLSTLYLSSLHFSVIQLFLMHLKHVYNHTIGMYHLS